MIHLDRLDQLRLQFADAFAVDFWDRLTEAAILIAQVRIIPRETTSSRLIDGGPR